MNLFLAPIQSMTIAYYRNSFAKHFGNIDEYYTPFIATSETKKLSELVKDLLPERNDASLKVIPQLLGNDGEHFRSFGSAISNMGYDEINWNIGCPFPMVTNKVKGSGILKYPDMIKKFLDSACSGNSYKVSVKMRLGFDNPEDGLHVINVLNEYPLTKVIIHARTGKQMYTGRVDLDTFETLSSICKHEVTYNGDIFTYNDFLHISSRFPNIKNFMLGRGALSDPFLPAEIKGHHIPLTDKMNILKSFHDDIFNYYHSKVSGDKHLCDRMKEFWDYMHVHLDKDGKFMKKIKKCHRTSEYLELTNRIFDSALIE